MATPSNVIWIEPDIDNIENQNYLKKLQTFGSLKIRCFNNVNESISLIKSIKFIETNIIISGTLFIEFRKKFEENIRNIYIIPKIIIFTKDKQKFVEETKISDLNNCFYTFGGIHTSFKEIIKFIINPIKKKKNKEEEIQLTFEFIDCKEKLLLPMFYKILIDIISKEKIEKYIELLYNKYSNNAEVKKLLNYIQSMPNIPIELLSKYFARLYTLESDFYVDLNRDIRENKKDNILPFIKILYEGVKLKSLPISSDKELYRGSKISKDEIKIIQDYLNKKINGLPGAIVFSKSFLSFSKDRNEAEVFISGKNIKNNLSKVLFILEKDEKVDYSLSTHADIENISFFNENEVLFFPFSSFEIKEIKEKKVGGEIIYEIKLVYLEKYLKEIENEKIIVENILPDCLFKKEIVGMGLIEEKKIKELKTKDIIKEYKEYKNDIKKIDTDDINEITIIYDIEKNAKSIVIFGEEFVYRNQDICKMVFEDKEYNLEENFMIKKYTNKNIKKLELKLRYIKNITNASGMFFGCSTLLSLPDIDKWNTKNVTEMSQLFFLCSSLKTLPDISKWDTSNVTDMSMMFSHCQSLKYLPDISSWNVSKVENMMETFYQCKSLKTLPDFSKWNIDMSKFSVLKDNFYRYLFASSSPDITEFEKVRK